MDENNNEFAQAESVLQVLNSFYVEHGGEQLQHEHLFQPKNCLLICIAFLKGLNLSEETFLSTQKSACDFLSESLSSNAAYINLDPFPEMVDSFAVLNVFAIMKYLLDIVDFEKETGYRLGLTDLYRGKKDFLMALYTAICDLYVSFKSTEAIFENTVSDALTKKEQQEEMTNNLSNLKLKLPQKKNSLMLLEEAVNLKSEENEKLSKSIQSLENQKNFIEQTETEQKVQLGNLDTEIENWTAKNEKIEREIYFLQGEIVSSPEKIVQERRNVQSELEKLHDEFAYKNSFIDNKRSFIVKYENLRSYLKKIIGAFEPDKKTQECRENVDVEKLILNYFSVDEEKENDFVSLTEIKKLQSLVASMSQKVNNQLETIEQLDEKLLMEGKTLQQLQETMTKKSNYHKILKSDCEAKEKQAEKESIKQKKSAQVISQNILNIKGNINIVKNKINEINEQMKIRKEQEKIKQKNVLQNFQILHENYKKYVN